jgi:hypothetical protein
MGLSDLQPETLRAWYYPCLRNGIELETQKYIKLGCIITMAAESKDHQVSVPKELLWMSEKHRHCNLPVQAWQFSIEKLLVSFLSKTLRKQCACGNQRDPLAY